MEIKSDTIYQIKSKVILYKNKKYFNIFRNIFISNTLNYVLSKNKTHITPNSKIKETSNNNNEKVSFWKVVANNIKKNVDILDYDLNNYRRNNNEENEDEYFLQFLKEQNKVIQINNLVFLYLNRISIMKLHKLIIISNKDKIPLINLMKIYLGLCSQNFIIKKKKVTMKDGSHIAKSFSKKVTKKFNTNEKSINIKEDPRMKKLSIVKIKAEKKLNESTKRNISLNQSKTDEENGKEKNDSAYDEMINEQIKKSINKLNTKNKNINNKILYSSSFARLFIGETDKESIREKYLSNFEIKKEKKLEKNKNKNLSSIFYKVFLSRFVQSKNNKFPLIEKGIENIFVKFKKNQEIIDKYSRLKNKNLNNDYFNDVFKRLNRTTTNKIEKINYNTNNANKKNKLLGLNKKKNIYKIQLPNKLTKTVLNDNRFFDNNSKKLENMNKTNRFNSFSKNKMNYKNINKEKEKIGFINDYNYNYNSRLKNYLNLNEKKQIKTIVKEERLSKNNIKKQLIKREKEYNNDIITLNGNFTTRVKNNINESVPKYKIFKQENEQGKNNFVINFINRNELFFENL